LPVLILVISFFILLAIGVPVAWSLGISSTLTILISLNSLTGLITIAQRMATGVNSFTLLSIPFFILAGKIMNRGGIAERLIEFDKTLIGTPHEELSYFILVVYIVFGAITGAAVEVDSAIGPMLDPRMEKEGYDRAFGADINITYSTTGLIIPPS